MHNLYFIKEAMYTGESTYVIKVDNVEYVLNEDAVFLPLLMSSDDQNK